MSRFELQPKIVNILLSRASNSTQHRHIKHPYWFNDHARRNLTKTVTSRVLAGERRRKRRRRRKEGGEEEREGGLGGGNIYMFHIERVFGYTSPQTNCTAKQKFDISLGELSALSILTDNHVNCLPQVLQRMQSSTTRKEFCLSCVICKNSEKDLSVLIECCSS